MNLRQLRKRAAQSPSVAQHWLDLALALDERGQETEAIPAYEKALRLGLSARQRHIALLSLASSYRETGQLRRALATVERARREYRNNAAVESFHALILLDCDQSRRAVRILGSALVREARRGALGDFEEALKRKFRGVTQRK